MRRFAFLILMVVSAAGFSQENLARGQNLLSYLKDHPPTFKTAGPKVLNIPEGTIDYYKYKEKTDKTDIRILIILDKYPVGVLQSVNGTPQLLFDLSGDGVLDTEVQSMEIPYWVVAWNTDEKQKTATNNVKKYLDGYYQMFQGDANPATSGKLKDYTDTVLRQVVSGNGENRDLLYALYVGYEWGNRYPGGTAAAAEFLAGAYFQRFKADHPLFYLQFIESFIVLGDLDNARKILANLLKMDAGFVPAQVYRWQLETDPDKKRAYLADLKKTHPNHWIVSQLPAK